MQRWLEILLWVSCARWYYLLFKCHTFRDGLRDLMRTIVLSIHCGSGDCYIILSGSTSLARFSPANTQVHGPGRAEGKIRLSPCCSCAVGSQRIFNYINLCQPFLSLGVFSWIYFEGWIPRLHAGPVRLHNFQRPAESENVGPLVQKWTMSRQHSWAPSQVWGPSECGALCGSTSHAPVKPAIKR